jgi:predicted O-methyltransferase YrrM
MLMKALIEKLVPGYFLGNLEYHSHLYKKFYGFGVMNGQTSRLEICRKIICSLGVSRIIETGTYRGMTTLWLAKFNIPVTTIEMNDRLFTFSKLRLGKHSNIKLLRGNSVEVLNDIISKDRYNDLLTFYYLDAHWNEYLPLADELRLIRDRNPTAIILIDDFQVPDDAGYKYDDYGGGNALNMEYLSTHGVSDFEIFFPKTLAEHETGLARGYCILTRNAMAAEKLAEFNLLRRWPQPL